MFKVSHATMICISGIIWLVMGCFLLSLGLNFIVGTLLIENAQAPHPVLHFFSPFTGGLEPSALLWTGIAFLIGLFKGRTVFAKSVTRSVNRILTLKNPAPISQIYPPAYYILLSSMVLLGVLVRYTPMDIRGGVDVAVGSALITGAILYFKQAWLARRRSLEISN